MDLLQAVKTTTREVEFTLPGHKDGDPGTGLFITLRSESSPQVQAASKKMQAIMLEEKQKGKKGDEARAIEWFKDNRIPAHVAGWRWEGSNTINGEQPEYSEQRLKQILKAEDDFAYFLRSFIESQIADVADFLVESGNSLQQQ